MTLPTDAVRPRLLMIDDDRELAAMVGEFLGHEGFELESADTPDQADAAMARQLPDLVILDVMLPQRSGFDVLRRIRSLRQSLPVLMLTARGDAIDRVLGLELGADDYLTKPFDPRELAARIRAILRRAQRTPGVEPDGHAGGETEASGSLTRVGSLQIDSQRRRVAVGAAAVDLTGAEMRVLLRLARDAGRLVTRAALTEDALGRKLTLYDRSIDTHVSNLRRKLESCGASGVEIRALRGAGYELVAATKGGS
jgi:DNA-binding response OmpR family regulator